MPIKADDLCIPEEKMEKEYQVVSVTQWQKDGELLGWKYECILPKLRYEKINVKVASEFPAIKPEELEKYGVATVTFTNLEIHPWGRVNGDYISYTLIASADSVSLVQKPVPAKPS